MRFVTGHDFQSCRKLQKYLVGFSPCACVFKETLMQRLKPGPLRIGFFGTTESRALLQNSLRLVFRSLFIPPVLTKIQMRLPWRFSILQPLKGLQFQRLVFANFFVR